MALLTCLGPARPGLIMTAARRSGASGRVPAAVLTMARTCWPLAPLPWLEGLSPQAAVTVATGMRQGESRVS
jgi:hypothetical protein